MLDFQITVQHDMSQASKTLCGKTTYYFAKNNLTKVFVVFRIKLDFSPVAIGIVSVLSTDKHIGYVLSSVDCKLPADNTASPSALSQVIDRREIFGRQDSASPGLETQSMNSSQATGDVV